MTGDWRRLDAVGLAEAFRNDRLDPVEVVEDCLAKAGEGGPTFLLRTGARARREAEAARDRLREGRAASLLDGVPLAWKDLFDMEGVPTTAGAAFRRDAKPAERDAPIVADLARAGLVSIGKTNLSELAFSGLGVNPHFGTPAHPTIAGAVPGGSSSGSAVAVASSIVPLAFGSDTAGSVRVPAAFTDVFGYRPSIGRYDLDCVFPLAPSFDTAGPFARSLRDIVALDTVLTGSAPTADLPAPHFVVDDAILADPRVTDAVRDRIEQVIERLGLRHGAAIERRDETVLTQAGRIIERDGWIGTAEAFVTHEALLAGPDADRLDPTIRARLERGERIPLASAVRLYQAREALVRRLRGDAPGVVYLMPAVGHAPPLLADIADGEDFARVNLLTLRLSMIGSFLGMPGITLPLGAGVGLLVTASDGADANLFGYAAAIEAAGARAP